MNDAAHRHSRWQDIKTGDSVADPLVSLRLRRAMEIGERFVEERQRRRWRQADVARRAGLAVDLVDRAELGDPDLPIDTLDRISQTLGLTLVFELRAPSVGA